MDTTPVLSPDGKTIFYRDRESPDVMQLMRFDIESRHETELKRSSTKSQFLSSLALSPDGSQLAYGLYDSTAKSTSLSVMAAAGGPSRKVHEFHGEADFSLGWNPDQHYLLWATSEASGRQTMWKVPVSGGEAEKMFEMPSVEFYHPQFQPGTRRLVFGTIQNACAELWALDNFLPQPGGSR